MAYEKNNPHKWIDSPLGHGESQCVYRKQTNREVSLIGDMNNCTKAPKPKPETTSDSCYVICPYCGCKHDGASAELTEDGEPFECGDCESFFTASAVRSVDYIGAPRLGDDEP